MAIKQQIARRGMVITTATNGVLVVAKPRIYYYGYLREKEKKFPKQPFNVDNKKPKYTSSTPEKMSSV